MQPRPLTRLRYFHFLLFAAYPALALLAFNAGQVKTTDGLRPLLICLLLALLIYALYRLLLRNPSRAALATTLTLIVLLSYGHIYNGLKLIGLPGDTLVRHRYLLPVVLALLGLALWLLSRREPSRSTSAALTLMGLVALAFPVSTLVLNWGRASLASSPAGDPPFECSLRPSPGAPRPDIYLIVMDAYERDDILREMHGSDITPFLESLERKGFYIVRGGLSNYRHTELSLASILNMDYIQSFPEKYTPDNNDRWEIAQMVRDNRLRRELECLGYMTVATETSVFWTEWDDADYFLARDSDPLHNLRLLGSVSPFEGKFLDTTMARAVLDGFRTRQGSAPPAVNPNESLRDTILFEFDQLERMADLPSPKLVFVHILSPHPPIVFGPEGQPISQADFETTFGPATEAWLLQGYADQVTYLNRRLDAAVTSILDSSGTSPVIVIQGDHGWADRNPEDKLSILNAIHLPQGVHNELYPTLTPVNTFRIILDEYLGGQFGRLPDVSYFSHEIAIYDFVEVPNTWSP